MFSTSTRFMLGKIKNCCPTLTANRCGGHNVPLLKDDKGIRKLTPRECFNFKGFPLDYKLQMFVIVFIN